MLNILINSYTCCPGMGSEQGMGWNWIMHLASHCNLHIISEGEYRPQVEQWMAMPEHESLAQNMHFYWNPVPQSTRDKCWNQGNWLFYPLYEKWQLKTAEIAREICQSHQIDILHQLNMIGFREPGYLWKVSQELGIPFVWGPVDAKDKFPMKFLKGEGVGKRLFLWLKNRISIWQLKHSRRVREAAYQAKVLLAASSNSVASFEKYLGLPSILMNETGCTIDGMDTSMGLGQSRSSEHFDILWVGKMDTRKQLGLAIATLSKFPHSDVMLHVLGSGNDSHYKKQAARMGIADHIRWYGQMPHAEVQKLMQRCHVLLFTSVTEGTPHVVLESIANGLPVVCHDTCGQGDSVTPEVGIKIPVVNPKESVRSFVSSLVYLHDHPEQLQRMSASCRSHAETLSWENKALQMVSLYTQALS